MAHIVRRGESFCVVYYYTDKDGKRHQKWETFHQEAKAERRKAEVEIGKKKSTLIVPSKITVSELMVDFVNLYGERKWDVSTYSSNLALIANYINPLTQSTHPVHQHCAPWTNTFNSSAKLNPSLLSFAAWLTVI